MGMPRKNPQEAVNRPLFFIEERIDAAAQIRKKLEIPMPLLRLGNRKFRA
jgi:hypothetical protein